MNVLKVVLGFVEMAAALKFLSNADLVWGLGLLPRPLYICRGFETRGLLPRWNGQPVSTSNHPKRPVVGEVRRPWLTRFDGMWYLSRLVASSKMDAVATVRTEVNHRP